MLEENALVVPLLLIGPNNTWQVETPPPPPVTQTATWYLDQLQPRRGTRRRHDKRQKDDTAHLLQFLWWPLEVGNNTTAKWRNALTSTCSLYLNTSSSYRKTHRVNAHRSQNIYSAKQMYVVGGHKVRWDEPLLIPRNSVQEAPQTSDPEMKSGRERRDSMWECKTCKNQ